MSTSIIRIESNETKNLIKSSNFIPSGNKKVDTIGEFEFKGNIIPHSWYKTILRNNKPYLTAMTILGEIAYWYRPIVIKDEKTNKIIGFRKKFAADLLQLSYPDLVDKFGFSRNEVYNAMVFLEKLGVIKRYFRTINTKLGKVPNVMYIDISCKKLYELTFTVEETPKRKEYVNVDNIAEDETNDDYIPEDNDEVEYVESSTDSSDEVEYLRAKESFDVSSFKRCSKKNNVIEISDIQNNKETEEMEEENLEDKKKKISKEVSNNTENNIIKGDDNYLDKRNDVFKKIKDQVGYDSLLISHKTDKEQIDELILLLYDIISQKTGTVWINRAEKCIEDVKEVFKRINYSDIVYVLGSLNENKTKISKPRNYLLTTLYNAKHTKESYFKNVAAYDMRNTNFYNNYSER